MNKHLRRHRKNFETMDEKESADLMKEIAVEVYAESIILDWGGDIEGPNGENPPECTKENIIWLFTEDCPDLFENLRMRLDRRSTWRPEDKEAAEKNSETASVTS